MIPKPWKTTRRKMTRIKKKALEEVLIAKKNFVATIHPIHIIEANNVPIYPDNEECCHIEYLSTLLENAIHNALRYIVDNQAIVCLHDSLLAVIKTRKDISNWHGGGSFPTDLKHCIPHIIPQTLLMSDEFIEITEDYILVNDKQLTIKENKENIDPNTLQENRERHPVLTHQESPMRTTYQQVSSSAGTLKRSPSLSSLSSEITIRQGQVEQYDFVPLPPASSLSSQYAVQEYEYNTQHLFAVQHDDLVQQSQSLSSKHSLQVPLDRQHLDGVQRDDLI